MRLWHEALIPYLDRQRLLGLHRECCALRGGGWGKKHATVDYVFTHPYEYLEEYHFEVIREMVFRGYHPNLEWLKYDFHRTCKGVSNPIKVMTLREMEAILKREPCIYPEHNEAYLQECIDNLAGKGIIINREDIK